MISKGVWLCAVMALGACVAENGPISTQTTLIGVESKRYEPFRPAKASGSVGMRRGVTHEWNHLLLPCHRDQRTGK